MDNLGKISAGASVVIALLGLYSIFVSQLLSPMLGLGIPSIWFAVLVSIISAVLVYKNHRLAGHATLVLNVPILFIFSSYQIFSIVAQVLALAAMLPYLKQLNLTKGRMALFLIVAFAVVYFMATLYLSPSAEIARGAGTVLSDNWWNGLNWIKNNTPECAVVATYWDPGHFIREIAQRGVVFDGATQGATRTISAPGRNDGLIVTPYDHGIKQITVFSNNTQITSRINDIAISLMTANETLALELLEKYRVPGCDSMYYIASSDLIGKSTWWTYFSTWDPTVGKGVPANYFIANLGSVRPVLNQDALIYSYPISQNQAFVLVGVNDTFRAYLQQTGSQPVGIESLLYYTASGNLALIRDQEAPIKGSFLVQPDKRVAIFMPPELEESIFTRMFLYNGAGLQHFEYVNEWGGEVKLFKVNFPSENGQNVPEPQPETNLTQTIPTANETPIINDTNETL